MTAPYSTDSLIIIIIIIIIIATSLQYVCRWGGGACKDETTVIPDEIIELRDGRAQLTVVIVFVHV